MEVTSPGYITNNYYDTCTDIIILLYYCVYLLDWSKKRITSNVYLLVKLSYKIIV